MANNKQFNLKEGWLSRHTTWKNGIRLTLLSFLTWFIFVLPADFQTPPFATTLYDAEGNLLGARIAADGQWRFTPSAVPVKFREAITTFEDRHFFTHPGINPVSLIRAVYLNVKMGGIVSGGSTLTMQTVRISRGNPPRTISEKIYEILLALRMEFTYSKGEILQMYAGYAPFGGNTVGLEAASHRYFNKSPGLLSWSEAALLAVLPNAPGLIHPGRNQDQLLLKRNRLLKDLWVAGKIDQETYDLSIHEPIPSSPSPVPAIATHLLDRIIAEGGAGQAHHSTLNLGLQKQAEQILERHMLSLRANHVYNGAILITHPGTGKVLAYVGNAQENLPGRGNAVDIVTARRSPGSLLKPFLYGYMLEEGLLLPQTLVADYPVSFKGYSPTNFSREFDGAVPANTAIARSLNIPAVLMLKQTGASRFYRFLRDAGFRTIDQGASHYGLSLVLGGVEVTLWDLAAAYGNCANMLRNYHGSDPGYEFPTLHFTGNPAKVKPFLGAGSIWFMAQAMTDVSRPEADLNWKYFSSGRKVAWKTGTSYGHRDAWAVGFTPDHVVAVWMGNASGEGRPGLTGLSAAAPVMLDIFRTLPRGNWFDKPYDALNEAGICRNSGFLAGKDCPDVAATSVPQNYEKTTTCPYHKLVHLNEQGTRQVNSSCYPMEKKVTRAWFSLPPAMESYYRARHPEYIPLPPFLDGCITTETPIELVYPGTSAEIYLPVNLDGSLSETIFEAAHNHPGVKIYWHLDQVFAGITEGPHRIALQPSAGTHTITLVDEQGNRLSRLFTVAVKKRKNRSI